MAGGDQQLDQAIGPGLPHLLEDIGQFAQVMGIAQSMGTRQIPVGLPAVVNQGADELGKDAEGIECPLAPIGMTAHPGQPAGGQDMQPVERPRDVHPRFVGMDDRKGLERLTDRRHRRLQSPPGLCMDRQHRGIRQRQSKQVAHQLTRAGHRHHVLMRQLHDSGLQARTILHRSRYLGGEGAAMRFAARTDDFEHPMFRDLMAQRWNVKHLPRFNNGPLRQGIAAGVAALRWCMGLDVIGIDGLLQRVAPMSFLATVGLVPRLALRFWLGAIQTIRGRWLAGVATVLRQAPFEFGNLACQHLNLLRQRLYLRKQRTNQIVLLSVAKSIKIGQFVHAFSYRLAAPSLKPGIAMLFRPT